ncbi:MAG: Gfo/Idh/MocA family protein [Vicinamibacterales bacterium]
MKSVIVGLGIQGRKRLAVAGPDGIGAVDPVAAGATWTRIEDVPLGDYDAALVCTPDGPKVELLTYLLSHGKHVLVEKPLVAAVDADLETLKALAARTGAVCYTAYNHRFEPHLETVKRYLDEDRIGRVYHCRMFYGNGTARDVRNSPWRDKGLGVIPDLASHMLDLVLFWFGRPAGAPQVWTVQKYENAAYDYFLMGFPESSPVVKLEGTLLSWRNAFGLDLVGERGSLHVTGLCKWGPTSLVLRGRVLPSGKPDEEIVTLEQKDPTWVREYDYFRSLCRRGGSNIDNDIWINGVLNGLGRSLGVEMLA